MAICEFATWHEITGDVGKYKSLPFKIVHHTTEGHKAEHAFDAFKKNRSDPHFTVDHTTIYQHIDTERSARSLRNNYENNTLETNRNSAIQIELVGFAHLSKRPESLQNLARLLRWIELIHNIPQTWPNGYPKQATLNGKDPGGHNRDATTWDSQSGHYGHCHVPENTHWDPAYSANEIAFIMEAKFDEHGTLINRDELPSLKEDGSPEIFSLDIEQAVSTMPDHHVID